MSLLIGIIVLIAIVDIPFPRALENVAKMIWYVRRSSILG